MFPYITLLLELKATSRHRKPERPITFPCGVSEILSPVGKCMRFTSLCYSKSELHPNIEGSMGPLVLFRCVSYMIRSTPFGLFLPPHVQAGRVRIAYLCIVVIVFLDYLS